MIAGHMRVKILATISKSHLKAVYLLVNGSSIKHGFTKNVQNF